MLSFKIFSRYLEENPQLQNIDLKTIGEDGKYVRQWAANLGMEPEAVQCQKIERLLAELNVAKIEDKVRLHILDEIRPPIQRAVGKLHQYYLHAPALLTEQQQQYSAQVSSFYYLLVIVYQGVINRASEASKQVKPSRLQRLIRPNAGPDKLLARALYEQMGLYVDLLAEAAILYQSPPSAYWQKLNNNYLLAVEHGCLTTPMVNGRQDNEGMSKPSTIQAYYAHACLLSLLKPNTYRRQDIIGILKKLDTWSHYLSMNASLNAQLKIFVDLDTDEPPQYLTAATKTNPYIREDRCLFIDVSSLVQFLQQNAEQEVQSQQTKQSEQILPDVFSQRIAKLALINLKPRMVTKNNLSDDYAVLIAGFSLIHYYIAGRSSLFNIIDYPSIDKQHLPNNNTTPKTPSKEHQLTVDVTEIGTTSCRLLWRNEVDLEATSKSKPNSDEQQEQAAVFNLQVHSIIAIKRIDRSVNDVKTKLERRSNTAHINSLNPNILSRNVWELGVIRSMAICDKIVDMGVQIIGTSATACGVRLDNKDGRRQNFVPALLLAGDTKLGTKTSLIMPKYHLRSGDRVVLRVANKERRLQLQTLLLKTDNIEQYTIVRTAV